MHHHVAWVDEINAKPDNGTMLIHARSGDEWSDWRMSIATFRKYAELGLRDINEWERSRSVLPFGARD